MKKRVLLTINPSIIRNRERESMRRFITLMDRNFDLVVLPINGYDFKRGLVRAFKRLKGGRFRDVGLIEPEGDLWVVYSDGYYLDHRRYGFRVRRDYFNAQIAFHDYYLSRGSVALMVNTPEAEARTLKSWLATLNFKETRVIPTYMFSKIDEVHDFQRRERSIVVKPVWGGATSGVELLNDEASVKRFHDRLERRADRDLSDYCFQILCRGPEKRLWFAGGSFITGRKFGGFGVPWCGWYDPCPLTAYNKFSHRGFAQDLAAAQQMSRLSGISVGSVDFIGNQINELNGAGTVLTEREAAKLFIDARPAVLKYLFRITNVPSVN